MVRTRLELGLSKRRKSKATTYDSDRLLRWLSKWSEASDESVYLFGREFPPQTDGRSAQVQYIVVYFIILAFSIIGTTVRSHWGGKRWTNPEPIELEGIRH